MWSLQRAIYHFSLIYCFPTVLVSYVFGLKIGMCKQLLFCHVVWWVDVSAWTHCPISLSGEVSVETKLFKENSTKWWASMLCHWLGPQAHLKQQTPLDQGRWRLPELCIPNLASFSLSALTGSGFFMLGWICLPNKSPRLVDNSLEQQGRSGLLRFDRNSVPRFPFCHLLW